MSLVQETHGLHIRTFPALHDVWTDTKINPVFVLKHSSQWAVLNLAKDTRLYLVTFIIFVVAARMRIL
jgi:hypothetical protein